MNIHRILFKQVAARAGEPDARRMVLHIDTGADTLQAIVERPDGTTKRSQPIPVSRVMLASFASQASAQGIRNVTRCLMEYDRDAKTVRTTITGTSTAGEPATFETTQTF